ncbi:hypothetical protein [Marinicellulosiphila megalodicopiae]|uniref:hypothetical protein n=1 Tax=Marinicellulosiphila megalodicopiae TaxID=2724896 RepID=UPI003BB0685D
MKGAGGNSGGIGQFFIGFVMMCGGFYLLLNSINVSSSFALTSRLYGSSMFGSQFSITGGIIMIPFMFGVGFLFFNSRNIFGWLLTIGSITALIFGVIMSIRFSIKPMSAFELISILVLAVGGLGLFLRSFKDYNKNNSTE